MLLKFKTLITVLSVDDKIIELALASDFKDFEDAIQYNTAIENGITTLLTRNLKDFKKAEIVILTAHQYLKSN
jgi:predicted nucleic acid-binding protein